MSRFENGSEQSFLDGLKCRQRLSTALEVDFFNAFTKILMQMFNSTIFCPKPCFIPGYINDCYEYRGLGQGQHNTLFTKI